MCKQKMNLPKNSPKLNSAAGLSLLELLVVIAMIAVVSSVGVVNFANSNRTFKVAGATRTLSNYMEKARLDSVRRHGGATVNINSTTSYTVNVDFTGSGTTTSRTVTLPANTTLSYTLPPATTSINPSTTPITITYLWRGNTASTVLLTLTDSAGGASSTVVVGSSGDVSTDTTITGPVTNPTPLTTVTTTTGIKSMQ
jgi:prepilin-type N-terminal cleavage/methylation domain-containing protein